MKCNGWLLQGVLFGANLVLLCLTVPQFSSVNTVPKNNNDKTKTQSVLVEDLFVDELTLLLL